MILIKFNIKVLNIIYIDFYESLLHFAVEQNNYEICHFLLNNSSINVNASNILIKKVFIEFAIFYLNCISNENSFMKLYNIHLNTISIHMF